MSRRRRRELHHLTGRPRLGTTSRWHGSSTNRVGAVAASLGHHEKGALAVPLRGMYNGGLMSETHKEGVTR